MYLVHAYIRPLWPLFTKSRSNQLGFGISVNLVIVVLFFLDTNVVGAKRHTGFIRERLCGDAWCAVPAQTLAGSVCGTLRASYHDRIYASFRGVPYARQPLGALRFAAPQPVDPWDGFFNASVEGPVCPQRDVLFGPMMQPRSMGEDCLHANVHVPAPSLPEWGKECSGSACLPVLVFLHGGAFYSGSGDSDMNGPEYMMDHDAALLITLNYRLGPFGFLSLNSSSVPGNVGLRDILTALQWVQTNARAFGGDPGRVTLMGVSAGAFNAHILSLSEAVYGLFQNVILMSGTATSGFSTLPSYAQYIKDSFLKQLGIISTDPDEIHSQLIALPYQALVEANNALLESTGFTVFTPVVESQFDEVTRILDDDPDVLLANGRGSNYTMLLGFDNNECASLKHTLEEIDIVEKIKKNAKAILPAKLLNSVSPEDQTAVAKQMMDRYFHGTPSLDKYIRSCSDSYFVYPALKLAETRSITGGAKLFLYQFSYGSPSAPFKKAYGIHYKGAGHMDDLSYVLRVNSLLKDTVLSDRDEEVKEWMTDIIANFVVCNDATCEYESLLWPDWSCETGFQYQTIRGPSWAMSPLTGEQLDMITFFDKLYGADSYPYL